MSDPPITSSGTPMLIVKSVRLASLLGFELICSATRQRLRPFYSCLNTLNDSNEAAVRNRYKKIKSRPSGANNLRSEQAANQEYTCIATPGSNFLISGRETELCDQHPRWYVQSESDISSANFLFSCIEAICIDASLKWEEWYVRWYSFYLDLKR
jgi:hypothetical protein